jgi:hypothetical protein
MTWDEAREEGRRVARSAKDLDEQLTSLTQDPRFVAVLGWLEQRKEAYVASGSAQRMAAHHGSLEHCMGSVFAYQELMDELKGMFEKKK